MKVLHLLSNWKWTGPAEPAVNLCWALVNRGHDAIFACAKSPGKLKNVVLENARERKLETVTRFNLDKHFNLLLNLVDYWALSRFLRQREIDLIHAHLPNDHLLGGRAAFKCGRAVKVVRSCYDGESLKDGRRTRFLLENHTDALIVGSRAAINDAIERFGFPKERIWLIDGAVDTARFDPSRKVPDLRARFGFEPTDFVVGIVARMQWHRRFDVLLPALKQASRKLSNLRVLIVGRGTNWRKVAEEPVRKLDLERIVKFAGYLTGDDFVGALAAMDTKVFLMPGSDGTCRAVREAMAMGVPVLAARRGMLPELVADGRTGLIVDDTVENITSSLVQLGQNSQWRRKLGREALKTARKRFSLETQARAVEEVYRTVLSRS